MVAGRDRGDSRPTAGDAEAGGVGRRGRYQWRSFVPYPVRFEVRRGDAAAGGVGRRGRYEWRSFVPYPVRFEVVATRIERPALLEGRATGELEGVGRWRLFEQDQVTAVLYEWNVRTTKRWMNAIGPVAAPVFRWNHDYVMRGGGRGIADRLGVRLLAA